MTDIQLVVIATFAFGAAMFFVLGILYNK